MPSTQLQIETADGQCPTHAYYPHGSGPFPGVIVYMDAVGIRPAMMEIAERIASSGYYVLLPDLFYRVEFDAGQATKFFTDPVFRQDVMTRVMPTASHANVMRDTEALLAHLESRPDVQSDRIGLTGYCMGGRLALNAAGHFGERITAAASYHGGRLATDAPDSPHRLALRMKARVYVAGAIDDPSFDEAQKARLEQDRCRCRSYDRDMPRSARLGALGHAGSRRGCDGEALGDAVGALPGDVEGLGAHMTT